MAEKKGFSIVAIATLVLYLLVQINTADAATYIVGDNKGWQWDAGVWPNGKTFRAGDVLLFKYLPGMHTVGMVKDKAAFDSCDLSGIVRELKSGNDYVTLVPGDNYFMCGIMGHCLAKMKMKVTAILN